MSTDVAPILPFSDSDMAPLVELARQIVESHSQIFLSENQFSMIASRLVRRIYELNLDSPAEYYDHIQSNLETESTVLISLLTTHHTHFFREFEQFEFLVHSGLQQIISAVRAENRSTIHVASLACSRGHEVYTIAMFLRNHLAMIAPDLNFRITGVDIDPDSVAIASNGVYPWDEVKSVPALYALDSWQKGTGAIKDFVRISDHLKQNCEFKTANLLNGISLGTALGAGNTFDLVFCRNVFLYFTDAQIASTVNNILKFLKPSGYFFIGISESLMGRGVPVSSVGRAIYTHTRKPETKGESAQNFAISASNPQINEASSNRQLQAQEKPLRILCVDDSPTILSLLKAILTKEHGFSVVATAKSGIEAQEKLRSLEIDAMTLDIHMPRQGGIEYLESNFGVGHPPVVILSSAERDEEEVGRRAIALGASDYIEKPSISNLNRSGEEIRTKLWSAAMTHKMRHSQSTKDLPSVVNFVRVIFCTTNDRFKLAQISGKLGGDAPLLVLLCDCDHQTAETFRQQLSMECRKEIFKISSNHGQLAPGSIYLGSPLESESAVLPFCRSRWTAVYVCIDASKSARIWLPRLGTVKIFVENNADISAIASHKQLIDATSAIPVEDFMKASRQQFEKSSK